MKTVVDQTPETLYIYFWAINNAFTSSDRIAQNVMINENDLERMWEEIVMA
jgi:hypothetical protein